MKKTLALLLAVLMLASTFVGCTALAENEEGKVFNIYAWNEEFKGFFEKYYTVPEGVTVNWIITPSNDGAYQDKLDEALLNQENVADDEKVDLFLAEADYIQKYTDSFATQDVQALGVTDFSNAYEYTVQTASDASGVVKGVSFQCCPAALIYRRRHSQRGALIGLGAGVVCMVALMLLWNYFITPLYMGYPREAVAAMLPTVFLPFNLVKSLLNAAITVLIYKPVSRALKSAGLMAQSATAVKPAHRSAVGAALIAALVLASCVFAALIMRGVL